MPSFRMLESQSPHGQSPGQLDGVMPSEHGTNLELDSRDVLDDIEHASAFERELFEPVNDGKEGIATNSQSLDLKRTASRASNVLERVFTTRSIVDPGPPPDGGWKAWSQVACGWIVLFTTWVRGSRRDSYDWTDSMTGLGQRLRCLPSMADRLACVPPS